MGNIIFQIGSEKADFQHSMRALATFGALAAVSTLGDAKDFNMPDGRKGHQVELSVGDDLCIFENADDQWCFSATPPMIVAGWEFAQTYTTTAATESPVLKYYQLEFKPYSTLQGNIVSTLF